MLFTYSIKTELLFIKKNQTFPLILLRYTAWSWFLVSIDLNSIAIFQQTFFDRLLSFAVILKWWNHNIIQYLHHIKVFLERIIDFTFTHQALCCFLQNFRILKANTMSRLRTKFNFMKCSNTNLNCFQAFQNICKFTAFDAFDHKFITIFGYYNNIVAILLSSAPLTKKIK